MPSRLDVISAPQALPKAEPKPEPITGLWDVPKLDKPPKGPSLFQINVGRAIDALRHDYPLLFTQKPDLSIFTKDVELWDPSGKRLSGIGQYSRVFELLAFLRRTTMQDAKVTYRLVVADEKIRVRWSAQMWMRDPALGLTTTMTGEPALVHLDGVSNYELDSDGKIYRHRLENIVLRGKEEEPVQLVFAWPSARIATPTAAIPFFRSLDRALPAGFDSLFSSSQPSSPSPAPPKVAEASRARVPMMSAGEWDVPRKETPMERAAREREEDAENARRLAALRAPREEKAARGGLFGAFSLPQPCDTSYDCERPEVCCDLLFGSVCCSAGLMTPLRDDPPGMMQPQAIPIPVERDNGGAQLPPQSPRYPGDM